MGYKKHEEWGRPGCAKDVDKCCNCNCNCNWDCDRDCKKEEPKKHEKEKCHEDGKLVLVFNTCIGGDVSIHDSFKEIFKENFNNNSDNFNIKDSLKDAIIVKDILSHNTIEILSRNCVDLMIDSVRDILNEAFKNALRDSLNHSGNDEDNTEIKDNFSCNKDSFEMPIGNEETNSSSCAKSEGFSVAIAKNKLDGIEEYEVPGGVILEEEGISNV